MYFFKCTTNKKFINEVVNGLAFYVIMCGVQSKTSYWDNTKLNIHTTRSYTKDNKRNS
jgi:hypothetical protein